MYAEQSKSHIPVVVRGGAIEAQSVPLEGEALKWTNSAVTQITPTEPLPAEGSAKSVRVDLSKIQDMDEDVKQALNNGGLWDMI